MNQLTKVRICRWNLSQEDWLWLWHQVFGPDSAPDDRQCIILLQDSPKLSALRSRLAGPYLQNPS